MLFRVLSQANMFTLFIFNVIFSQADVFMLGYMELFTSEYVHVFTG